MKKIIGNIVWFALMAVTPGLWAQDDVASRESILIEQQSINFQTFFFEAIQQKAIGNFDKAIYALEACNNIEKDNKAVQFELSKNYAYLLKFTEAEYYILRGLERDPENLYMLRHLKEIKTKQNDYAGAIAVQEKILRLKPEEESELVLLYIKSGELEKAVVLIKKLNEENRLPKSLVPLKSSLLQENNDEIEDQNIIPKVLPKSKLDLLKEGYSLKKDFNSLQLLLEREWKTKHYLELLEDSEKGLVVFPSQSVLYLMNARALNRLMKYQQALERLEEGLDFLIDDTEQEIQFYQEMSLGHKGMGNNKMATKFDQLAQELKNK